MPRCKLSLRNPVYGAPEILCRERFVTGPYNVLCNNPAPCLARGRMRGAVATGKEQLLVRPREGERAETQQMATLEQPANTCEPMTFCI
jgi:hypothetical protein